MIRKWLIFAVSAALLVAAGVVAGPGQSKADDDKESPLAKIMEKVNKNNTIIQKGTRTKVAFAKAQKDVEKSAKDLVKLAKEAKPLTDAVKKAKDVPQPQKRWDELIDELLKTAEKLGQVAGKPNAAFQDAKDAFGAVKKVCNDCHTDFRIDETKF
jgi:cytochrome c556